MGRNLERDAVEMAAKNQRILENGLRVFAGKSFDQVNMTEVSAAAGIAISSLYRYYSTKPKLVVAINAWAWEEYYREYTGRVSAEKVAKRTGAEDFDDYLESFLDLYRNHRDLLRFNQFFNMYIQSENISREDLIPYTETIHRIAARFHETYRKGQQDGTLRTDMPEAKMFTLTLHLMMAVVTRYAVGLAYNENSDAEEELQEQKNMLLRRFTAES